MPKKGTTSERGYGAKHRRLRADWQSRIDAGERVVCWRCDEAGEPHLILPGEPFDLGHDDLDRTKWRGPECPSGNRATAGRKLDAELNSQVW
jgi:hypothetical protein